MGAIASQITSLTIVYSADYSGVDQSKHQSSASLAFVWGIHRGPVNSPHKGPVTRNVFPFDDVIMKWLICTPLVRGFQAYIIDNQTVGGWYFRFPLASLLEGVSSFQFHNSLTNLSRQRWRDFEKSQHRLHVDLSVSREQSTAFTHLPLDKMAAISQTMFSGRFS